MDALFRRELGSAEVDHSTYRENQFLGGNNDECDTFADRPAPSNAKTDGDSVADADAAPDRVSRSGSETSAAACRPARVRVCGYTRAGDRGNHRCGGEEQKAKEARTKKKITNFDGNRSP